METTQSVNVYVYLLGWQVFRGRLSQAAATPRGGGGLDDISFQLSPGSIFARIEMVGDSLLSHIVAVCHPLGGYFLCVL